MNSPEDSPEDTDQVLRAALLLANKAETLQAAKGQQQEINRKLREASKVADEEIEKAEQCTREIHEAADKMERDNAERRKKNAELREKLARLQRMLDEQQQKNGQPKKKK